jgi:hypothetical protein
MKVPQFLLSAVAAVALSLQAWTLNEVVKLKVELAQLTVSLQAHIQPTKSMMDQANGKSQP